MTYNLRDVHEKERCIWTPQKMTFYYLRFTVCFVNMQHTIVIFYIWWKLLEATSPYRGISALLSEILFFYYSAPFSVKLN